MRFFWLFISNLLTHAKGHHGRSRKKVVTPDWVTKRQRRERFFGVVLFGFAFGCGAYMGSAALLNLFTHAVEIVLWKNLLVIGLSLILAWTSWGIVPKKSVWISRLEKRRTK